MSKNQKIIKRLEKLIANKTAKVFDNGNEDYTIATPEEIIYIRSSGSKIKLYLNNQTILETKERIGEIKKKFKDCPNFISGDEISLINTEYISHSTYEYGEYRVYFENHSHLEYARITPNNAKKFKAYLKINSLRWVKYYKRSMSVCQRFDIKIYENDIRDFDRETILSEFSDSNGNFVMTRLLYNLIWQVYNKMLNGELPEDDLLMGNIRSFWYTYYKPILATLDMVDEKYYSEMIEAFTKFTADWKLFKYKDWDFLDIKRYNKKIGKGERIYIIMVAEKEGHLRILEHIHKKFKVTTIALGGESSVLSIEYFVDDLEEKEIDKEREFQIFFFTDYDPSGFNIQKTFIKKLKRHGIRNIKTHQIMNLDEFDEREIETNKFPLLNEDNEHSKTWKTIVRKWVRKSGGIGEGNWRQKAYGMEADSIKPGKVVKLFQQKVKSYL